jgi:hypothetical protein
MNGFSRTGQRLAWTLSGWDIAALVLFVFLPRQGPKGSTTVPIEGPLIETPTTTREEGVHEQPSIPSPDYELVPEVELPDLDEEETTQEAKSFEDGVQAVMPAVVTVMGAYTLGRLRRRRARPRRGYPRFSHGVGS